MSRNEEQLDRSIGLLLRVGVLLAASVVFAGGVWCLFRFGAAAPNYHDFHGEGDELRSVGGVLRGVAGLQPRSVIQLGLLLLIATPIFRVGFTVITYAAKRDREYFAITILVLMILVCSLAGLVTPPR